ncbi:platelet-derived growth factor subunit A [Callorhinchus milii]|uniref:Platelet-derived growth factor subunit A-like n=1 Tax=Callorhinchus milii TaxID=7868 RepID=A0A4W3JT67_CALMI|nr:platelet-derived growth factor subunit A [Callorhinchus milii]|eukprot:gi/632943102/ref/XP_007886775.1/ PREDICTED: platelet-derived growth factor subunit A-like [Callorhinchus milii]
MDLLQTTSASNMRSQHLVLVSLFCFWTVFSEKVSENLGAEQGIPEDILSRIAQADIRSVYDLEDLLGIQASEMRPQPKILGYSSTKPASCKPRPISVEIPRYKVDPSSAGFFLWPSCVEVDRCSGCCNTKTYKCIPSLTQFKSFQIAKLTYRYGRKELSVHTVTVQEHISCNCTELPRRHIMRYNIRYYRQSTNN